MEAAGFAPRDLLPEALDPDVINGESEDQPLAPEETRLAVDAFVSALSPIWPPSSETTFSDLMSRLSDSARAFFGASRDERSKSQALSKLRGDWFEWLLCVAAQKIEI